MLIKVNIAKGTVTQEISALRFSDNYFKQPLHGVFARNEYTLQYTVDNFDTDKYVHYEKLAYDYWHLWYFEFHWGSEHTV